MRSRFFIMFFFIGAGYLILVWHLYDIQFNHGSFYAAKAQIQDQASGILDVSRGNIYFTDKNNNLIPVVLNKNYSVVFAVPREFQQQARPLPEAALRQLSNILNRPNSEISNQLKKNNLYGLLAQKISASQAEAVKKLNLKGIYVKEAPFRFYPYGRLASHLLGFTSITTTTQVGRYGVEEQFNDLLAGASGESGKNLTLTIDQNIQSQAEAVLKNLMEKWRAQSGAIVVEEPFSGKILAMAGAPDFDPNNFSQSSIADFMNPAVQKLYEPGSVFKVITMASGIDSGKITPETTYIDKGYVILNGKKITNWDKKAYGKATMTNVIEHSINTGAVFAQRTIGNDIFKNYVYKFGFGEPTSINLPGEIKGNLRNLKSIYDIDWATASFGQGVAVTPIELISAFSAIANGGILMEPLVLADENPIEKRRVISVDTAAKLKAMMVSAVKKNFLADIPHYSIAGKTGTAFIPQNGKYTEEMVHTYIGFAPASHPLFVLLVKLERPKAPLAGQTVLPAFRELAQYILNYYNAPPDEQATSTSEIKK